jgi:SET domain-containing protein 6
VQDIAKGAEIHNTYGEHGNAELLYKYGFVLEENPFDTITVTPAELEEAAESVLGRRTARRMRFVRDETNVMEDDGDVMSLAPRTVVSAPAAAVLLVLGVPDDVFQGWSGISDAVAWYNATAAGPDASATAASAAAAEGALLARTCMCTWQPYKQGRQACTLSAP